jgi:hypothetical protein
MSVLMKVKEITEIKCKAQQCIVVDKEAHVPRVLVIHSTKTDGTLRLFSCYVRCLHRHRWKTNMDGLMPRWWGNCHPPRHGYYESS